MQLEATNDRVIQALKRQARWLTAVATSSHGIEVSGIIVSPG
jgi:hypothetical protein